MYKNNSDHTVLCLPPWLLQGEAYILNYWLSSSALKQAQIFGLTPSAFGCVVQIMLVRYAQSPIGAYDELLILDHPVLQQRALSNIPKIFVSTESSVQHGQQLWGIPKELATFEWQTHAQQSTCIIRQTDLELCIRFEQHAKSRCINVNSQYLPAALLKITQMWQGKSYCFSPSFRGQLIPLKKVSWQPNPSLFPDVSQARLLTGFYVPEFELIFPEAKIHSKK